MTRGSIAAILSYPSYESHDTILDTIHYFDAIFWISMCLSYLTIIAINCYHISKWREQLNLIFDYFLMFIGKGLNIFLYDITVNKSFYCLTLFTLKN